MNEEQRIRVGDVVEVTTHSPRGEGWKRRYRSRVLNIIGISAMVQTLSIREYHKDYPDGGVNLPLTDLTQMVIQDITQAKLLRLPNNKQKERRGNLRNHPPAF